AAPRPGMLSVDTAYRLPSSGAIPRLAPCRRWDPCCPWLPSASARGASGGASGSPLFLMSPGSWSREQRLRDVAPHIRAAEVADALPCLDVAPVTNTGAVPEAGAVPHSAPVVVAGAIPITGALPHRAPITEAGAIPIAGVRSDVASVVEA